MGDFERRVRPFAAPGQWRQNLQKESACVHGKPRRVIRDDQPDAREGQAGRAGVAERLGKRRLRLTLLLIAARNGQIATSLLGCTAGNGCYVSRMDRPRLVEVQKASYRENKS
jgi:hypothetical protein